MFSELEDHESNQQLMKHMLLIYSTISWKFVIHYRTKCGL